MPSIRKIRIVNFRYDDGAKLIPDEIFCAENDSGRPTDTLLNLDNGGGKTVLVQLMLQPICPKAKVQNRNIGEYFRNGSDHAFVLIEWALDGSAYSLLTGIALAASTNADDGNDRRNVRFFTFMHTYPQTGDRLDLVNFPLTERDGNHIRTLSYDDARKLLQNRKIEYYPADQLRRYQKKLADEYGILHTEWENILVRVNAVEGGISKFFEEYKTADRLLDRFIIPGVMPNGGGQEESLEEMFLNYAKSYAGQEENMRLQSRITAFTEKLDNMLPLMRAMWEHDDARLHAIRALADHIFTLQKNIGSETERKNSLERSVSLFDEKLRHIRAEKASAVYYTAKDRYDAAAAELDGAAQRMDAAKERRDRYEHLKAVLNAAKEHSELTEQRSLLEALFSQLRELDSDSGDAHIDSLRYSLYIAAVSLCEQAEKEHISKAAEHERYSGELEDIRCRISGSTEKYAAEKGKYDKLTGRREVLLEQITDGLDKLSLKITMMLDGSYSAEEIENIRADLDSRTGQAAAVLQTYEEEERQLAEEISAQNERRGEIAAEQADISVQLRDAGKLLAEYRERYDAAVKVTAHLSLDEESIFTDEPMKELGRITAELREKYRRAERSAEMLTEQISCIGNGQLHLPGAAVGFLKETGVPFRTGEKHLLEQPPEIRQKILAAEPAAAYSVIVNSEKEREKLLVQAGETWLSAIVPVFTLSDIAEMAEGRRISGGELLAAYEREYFSDAGAYEEKVRTALDDVRAEMENLNSQLGEWEHERTALAQFTYPAGYEAQLDAEITGNEEKKKLLLNELAELDRRRTEINERTAELKKLCIIQREAVQDAKREREYFESICGIISQYEVLNADIAECGANIGRISGEITRARAEENRTEELLRSCNADMELIGEQLDGYRGIADELKDSPEAEIIPAEYPVLLAEYNLYREQRSSDRKSLENRISDTKARINVTEKNLKRFGITPEEYENTEYSAAAYNNAEDGYRAAEREFSETLSLHTKAAAAHAAAESILKQAENSLRELHTELLDRAEVGSDHERRITECEAELRSVKIRLDDSVRALGKLTAEEGLSVRYAARFADDIADYTPKITENSEDADTLRDRIESGADALKRAENDADNYRRRELESFRGEHGLFSGTLDGIASVIGNVNIHGDRYFSLYERTEGDIRRYRERIGQLDILLRDVEDSRRELVAHCMQRAGRLHENLRLMSKKSTVQIGSTKKQMLRVELPDIDPSSGLSAARINDYIERQVRKFLSENEETVKSRKDHLEIRQLLNCYIGKETIPVIVFKIDKVIQNSRYRSWEDALKANSGGEQFVVFFSLVASVMNYARGLAENLSRSSGVLILDNPFGPISSPHLLEPMFRIAHHFNIQLICLTHLGTAAVTGCFDMVYQLKFRTLALSNVQILEAEAKQHMEHAYFLSEQISMF